MFGHRPDGKRINSIEPLVRITPYLMPMRCDAQVFLQHRLDYEQLARYIAAQNQKGERITFMQIIVASYVRSVAEHPEINRYILNKQFFSRTNCTVSFNILRDPNDAEAGETAVKIKFDLSDTIYDVRDRMNAVISVNRGADTQNFVDKLASFVLSIPGLPTALVSVVRLLDRYGLCPGALLDELPFHTGMYITNNASIGLHHVNHHIYNFGSTSMFVGMGSLERVAVVEDGKARMKRFLPIGITVDERVTSGAHFSGFFGSICRYFAHPELLEVPPEKVLFDPGCEYHVPKRAQQQASKEGATISA
ncbi:MAG: 2-oxo acid dehydrogenase subunit E2 [bacterium]|nr:2-oxo acid dehydrogenase subunit E2 [bacterium]